MPFPLPGCSSSLSRAKARLRLPRWRGVGGFCRRLLGVWPDGTLTVLPAYSPARASLREDCEACERVRRGAKSQPPVDGRLAE